MQCITVNIYIYIYIYIYMSDRLFEDHVAAVHNHLVPSACMQPTSFGCPA